jgi:NADPH:quinone reductase-like Zn-dependent oxidoreductase
MNEEAVYLATVPTPAIIFQMLWTKSFGNKKVKFIAAGLRSADKKAKDLALLKEIVEEDKVKSVIDRQYPLEQIVDAHKYVEKGGKRGSVVVTIN